MPFTAPLLVPLLLLTPTAPPEVPLAHGERLTELSGPLAGGRQVLVIAGATRRVGDDLQRDPDKIVVINEGGHLLAAAHLPMGAWTAALDTSDAHIAVALGQVGRTLIFDDALQPVAEIPFHAGSLAFSPDGRHLVLGAAFTGGLRAVDLQGHALWSVSLPDGVPTALLHLPDGRLVHGDTVGRIWVRDGSDGRALTSWQAYPEHVTALALSPSGLTSTGLRGEQRDWLVP